jgi:predicted dehydrogenase
MSKIRVGVIGTGHLGRFHARLYAGLKENVELVGIYDSDSAKAANVAAEASTRAYPEMQALLEECEAVSIAVPTKLHFAIAREAIAAGCHVFIEKPVCSTTDEAKELIDWAKQHDKLIQVGHIERFNGALMALSEMQLDPVFIEAHRLAGFTPRGADVAVVLDLMIHDIDLILSIVKSPIIDLQASGAAIISNTEDIANCRLSFANGCVANITASRISAKKMRKMRIFQRDAYLSIDFNSGETEIFHTEQLPVAASAEAAQILGALEESEQARNIYFSKIEKNDVNALEEECRLFAEAVANNRRPVVSGEDGLLALEIADQILEKIAEHRQRLNNRNIQK